MKLIHVVSGMDPKNGGISQAVRTMINGLDSEGVTNEVVCMEWPMTNTIDSIRIHYVGPGRSAWQYNAALATWLDRNMDRFDAVLVHGLWQYHTYAVYKLLIKSNEKKPPVFVMPHGMLDPWFQKAKGRKFKALRNRFIWKIMEHKIVNKSDGLFFTCQTEKILAKDTFVPYNPKSEVVVGLGVHAPPLFCEEMRLAFYERCPEIKHKNYLLFLSRIHVKKGIDLLIDAYLNIKSEGYELPALVIAGPGLATSYGLQIQLQALKDKNIHFPGMLDGPAKWGAFYECEAFVLPSHQENFGIAVVEAMACSKPVLISDQVNIWREIEANKGGLVEKDDLEGTEGLLKNWVRLSAIEKNNMSGKARETYLANYAVEQAVKKLNHTISSITQNFSITSNE